MIRILLNPRSMYFYFCYTLKVIGHLYKRLICKMRDDGYHRFINGYRRHHDISNSSMTFKYVNFDMHFVSMVISLML